ncbi:MAG: hypothetical protein RJB38_502 [Pseudomonadota bacterium]|jgi:pseudouridine synthase
MALERVQKILARAGIASRRKAEELILEGSVTINGQVARLGDQAEWGKDAIKVDGKLLTQTEAPVYLAFYKPKNVICAMTDPQGRPALADYFTRVQARIYPIGKLDFESEGLVLLTNDGEMAQKITQAKDLLQVYSIKVKGHPDAEMLKRISRGMKTEKGHLVRPVAVRIDEKLAQKAKVQVVMRGSSATDLKTLLESRGFLFDHLVRSAIGQISLGAIEPGEYRRLEASQIRAIFEQPELGMRPIESALEKDAQALARRERRSGQNDYASQERSGIRPRRAAQAKPRLTSSSGPRPQSGSSKRITPQPQKSRFSTDSAPRKSARGAIQIRDQGPSSFAERSERPRSRPLLRGSRGTKSPSATGGRSSSGPRPSSSPRPRRPSSGIKPKRR